MCNEDIKQQLRWLNQVAESGAAMVKARQWLHKMEQDFPDVTMTYTGHDAVTFEAPTKERAQEVMQAMREHFEKA
jgi:hypothetical protein